MKWLIASASVLLGAAMYGCVSWELNMKWWYSEYVSTPLGWTRKDDSTCT